jgi:hypothetical protein
MSELKSLIIPFLIGGTIIASVKYASTHLDNPALAAIIGGFPTGLLSIYFVSASKSGEYAHDYFFVTLILLASIMIFYLIHTYSALDKRVTWVIAVMFWVIMVMIRYFVVHPPKNSKKSS